MYSRHSFQATSTKLSEESSAFETAWRSAGSRDAYAHFVRAVRGPRPLACFRLSSGNSGGTGGVEASNGSRALVHDWGLRRLCKMSILLR